MPINIGPLESQGFAGFLCPPFGFGIEEPGVGVRALGRQQMEVLASILLEQLGRVDDIVVVHLDKTVGPGLGPRRA